MDLCGWVEWRKRAQKGPRDGGRRGQRGHRLGAQVLSKILQPTQQVGVAARTSARAASGQNLTFGSRAEGPDLTVRRMAAIDVKRSELASADQTGADI